MEHCEDDDKVGLDSEVDSIGKPTKQDPSDSRLEILIPERIFRDTVVCGA